MGINQKSVLDHLMAADRILKSYTRELEGTEFDHRDRFQKTFVISGRSLLSYLDEIARRYHALRDALVEYSVRRLLSMMAN